MTAIVDRLSRRVGHWLGWDEPPYLRHRRRLARRYLAGHGLEIGALHAPLPVPRSVRVTYVDRLPPAELRQQYPELANERLVAVDVVDDGERLTSVAPTSQDFIIANHFLEHAQDPIGTLRAHLRVLKPGGVLYLAVPSRHHTFDRHRPPTTWEHVLRDHHSGPASSYEQHLREAVALTSALAGPALEAEIDRLRALNYSIHFHVWDFAEFQDFLKRCRGELGMPFRVEYCAFAEFEILAILRKT